ACAACGCRDALATAAGQNPEVPASETVATELLLLQHRQVPEVLDDRAREPGPGDRRRAPVARDGEERDEANGEQERANRPPPGTLARTWAGDVTVAEAEPGNADEDGGVGRADERSPQDRPHERGHREYPVPGVDCGREKQCVDDLARADERQQLQGEGRD